ncbi:hypothetical protein ACP70R_000421 [Stipagrostis hirtigluma subsp. patula]
MHVFYNGFQTDERIATTLLDLHAECGRLEDARKVFDRMVLEDAQMWTHDEHRIYGSWSHGLGKGAVRGNAGEEHTNASGVDPGRRGQWRS